METNCRKAGCPCGCESASSAMASAICCTMYAGKPMLHRKSRRSAAALYSSKGRAHCDCVGSTLPLTEVSRRNHASASLSTYLRLRDIVKSCARVVNCKIRFNNRKRTRMKHTNCNSACKLPESHHVQPTLCRNKLMRKLPHVQIASCTNKIMHKSHHVQTTPYQNHIMHEAHHVQTTSCQTHTMWTPHHA